jgi:hypothetical protein
LRGLFAARKAGDDVDEEPPSLRRRQKAPKPPRSPRKPPGFGPRYVVGISAVRQRAAAGAMPPGVLVRWLQRQCEGLKRLTATLPTKDALPVPLETRKGGVFRGTNGPVPGPNQGKGGPSRGIGGSSCISPMGSPTSSTVHELVFVLLLKPELSTNPPSTRCMAAVWTPQPADGAADRRPQRQVQQVAVTHKQSGRAHSVTPQQLVSITCLLSCSSPPTVWQKHF